jgi:hypothetical protein
MTSEEIIDHLLSRVLPAAYTRNPGDPPLRYDLETAERTLGLLAARMNEDGTRDLLWWRIRNWAPLGPRAVASALVSGLVTGIGAAFVESVPLGIVASALAAISAGFIFGFRDASPSVMGPRPMRHVFSPSSIMYGLAVAGLPAAMVVGFLVGLTAGLPVGATAGLAFGLAAGTGVGLFGALSRRGIDSIEAVASLSPATSWQNGRAVGIVAGLAVALAAGLSLGLAGGVDGAPAIGIGIGFAVAVALWRTSALVVGLPVGIVVGISGGVAVGAVIGLTRVQAMGISLGLVAGLVGGAVLGLLGGLMYARTWPATLAFAQLAARWRTPFRLMSFLEDARKRNVLRTVGPVYQFRHARLQDRLAEQSLRRHPRPARTRASSTAKTESVTPTRSPAQKAASS